MAATRGEGGREGGSWKRTELVFTTERTGIKGRKCGAGRQAIQGPPRRRTRTSIRVQGYLSRRWPLTRDGLSVALATRFLGYFFRSINGGSLSVAEYFVMQVEFFVI